MERTLVVCYYPEQWDKSFWEESAKAMSDLGIAWVRINEFVLAQLEPRLGESNFQWLDEIIRIFGNQKLRVVLGTSTATPPSWVIDKILICLFVMSTVMQGHMIKKCKNRTC